MNNQSFITRLMLLAVSCCFCFYLIEQYSDFNYFYTTCSKIILFAVIPILFGKKLNLGQYKPLVFPQYSHIKLGIILGCIVYSVIIFAYLLFSPHIDWLALKDQLERDNGISVMVFPLVATYITFGNSFLEEFFFRGVIFLSLYRLGYKKIAYGFSAGLFAIYHMAIFQTWFPLLLLLLGIVALFIGGLIFNYIDTKSDSILNSWLVHIFADLAIITVGIKLFYFY